MVKVRDLIAQSIDIDVYDDVTEELGIAFCGPMELTDEGAEKFADVLDYDISLMREDDNIGNLICAIVHVDDDNEKVWKRKLKKASE